MLTFFKGIKFTFSVFGFALMSFLFISNTYAQDYAQLSSEQNLSTLKKMQKNSVRKNLVIPKKTPTLESSGIQKISGSVKVLISRGWLATVVSTPDFKKICPKINIIAKKSDGEMYKFTPVYHATRPAFGLPGGKIWCETEQISVPANENIYFIATVIDKDYKITPMKQEVSFKFNELQHVTVKIVKKE
ncbi:MAG: hypothetical protein ACQ9MH_09345 [Nitrospinales bacterium]